MLPKTYKTEGIILGRQNFGEADRIIHVFSKDYGKLTLIARGARKISSRKRGHIEIFSRVNLSAIRGKGLDIISEAEQVDAYRKIRKDLTKATLAYYFVEVVGRITREGEAGRPVYEILRCYLELLEETRSLKRLRHEFLEEMVIATGYWPKGKALENPDVFLESITEKTPNSYRIGKRVLS